jgi:hypothetical protein
MTMTKRKLETGWINGMNSKDDTNFPNSFIRGWWWLSLIRITLLNNQTEIEPAKLLLLLAATSSFLCYTFITLFYIKVKFKTRLLWIMIHKLSV